MLEYLRRRLAALFSPSTAPRPGLVPRSVRSLGTDEQVRWAYRRFKPEIARRVARGIRASAAEDGPRVS